MKVVYVEPYPRPVGMSKAPVLWECVNCFRKMPFFLVRCKVCKFRRP
jgi:hypothetical protein